MGGRGAKSGVKRDKLLGSGGYSAAFDVTMSDGTKSSYYFKTVNNENFYQREVYDLPQKTPLNMSPKEFVNRATANGAIFRSLNNDEVKRREEAYKKSKEETMKALSGNKKSVNRHRTFWSEM